MSFISKFVKNGEYENALEAVQMLIEAQPMELQWKYILAKLYQCMGEHGEARKLYAEVYEKDNSYHDAFFHMAVIVVDCGEYEGAVRMYEEKLKLSQDQAGRGRCIELAKLHFIQKNLDKAVMILEELAKEDPQDWEPYMHQSVFYSLSKRSVEAELMAAKCREVCPKNIIVDLVLQPPRGIEIFGADIQ